MNKEEEYQGKRYYNEKLYEVQNAIQGTRNEPVIGIDEVAEMLKTEWSKEEIKALIEELEE